VPGESGRPRGAASRHQVFVRALAERPALERCINCREQKAEIAELSPVGFVLAFWQNADLADRDDHDPTFNPLARRPRRKPGSAAACSSVPTHTPGTPEHGRQIIAPTCISLFQRGGEELFRLRRHIGRVQKARRPRSPTERCSIHAWRTGRVACCRRTRITAGSKSRRIARLIDADMPFVQSDPRPRRCGGARRQRAMLDDAQIIGDSCNVCQLLFEVTRCPAVARTLQPRRGNAYGRRAYCASVNSKDASSVTVSMSSGVPSRHMSTEKHAGRSSAIIG
jgi:hypothetical protein